jgi:hypothetical protein
LGKVISAPPVIKQVITVLSASIGLRRVIGFYFAGGVGLLRQLKVIKVNKLFYGLMFFGCGVAWLSGTINLVNGYWGYLLRGVGVLIMLVGAYIIDKLLEGSDVKE